MAKKIDNYTSEIREKNKHFFINGSNIEHGFNIYDDKDEGRPFFNPLASRVFPEEMEPYSYDIHIVKDGETLQNIAFEHYENTRLWWVIAEANHIQNPFDAMIAGLKLIVPKSNTITDILTEMRK